MKIFILTIAILSTFSVMADSKCDTKVMTKLLTSELDGKGDYAPENISSEIVYAKSLEADASATIIAGGEDISYKNTKDSTVDVFTFSTESIKERNFYALVADAKNCSIIEARKIVANNE